MAAYYLLDTNVVLRLIDRTDAAHPQCLQAVENLIMQGDDPCLAPQVLVEFWVVATRPAGASNGLGWDVERTLGEIQHLRTLFPLLPDGPDVFDKWLHLVASGVVGKRAHDARLAAFMLAHSITALLTLNPKDFKNFGIKIVEPAQLLAAGGTP